MKRNLRSKIITDIRQSLRGDLENHRRTTREELRNMLRPLFPENPPENQTSSPIPDNPLQIMTSVLIHASNSNTSQNLSNKHFIKPNTCDGFQSWSRYQKHFKIASESNGWSDEMKTAQILTRLCDKAQLFLEKLSKEDLKNYKKITETLNERFDK